MYRMHRFSGLLLAILAVCASTVLAASPARAANGWVWPVRPPHVVHTFDSPESRWGAGHRGIDIAARPGAGVHAVRAGTVTFADVLAGRGVVVVDHGALRSTYEPVRGVVRVGEHVGAGDLIGRLGTRQSHCGVRACLHLGILRGEEYLDPLRLLPALRVRLKPVSGGVVAAADHGGKVVRDGLHDPAVTEGAATQQGLTLPARAALGGLAAAATIALLTGVAGRMRRRG